MDKPLPYTIAVLCYLFDQQERVLLLHRRKHPNQDLYSPIGGKLHQHEGESPTACAIREIYEETGLSVETSSLHLTGIVSEDNFNDQGHWLMFLYEVMHPVHITRTEIIEGQLGWHDRSSLDKLAIPHTDRRVIWPLFWKYRHRFFAAHIQCQGENMHWRLEQPRTATFCQSATP